MMVCISSNIYSIFPLLPAPRGTSISKGWGAQIIKLKNYILKTTSLSFYNIRDSFIPVCGRAQRGYLSEKSEGHNKGRGG